MLICGLEKMHAGIQSWRANPHLAMAGSIRKSRSDGGCLRSLRGVFYGAENRAEDWFAANSCRLVECSTAGGIQGITTRALQI